MRKRIRIRRATRILSCVNGKIVRYTMAVMCLVGFMSCANSSEANDKSWNTYCQKYNVNPERPTEEQENFYLDCYSGSAEEERDLTGVVAFHFDTDNVSQVVRGVLLKDRYYIVYNDMSLGFDNECIAVDLETANMVKTAISSAHGKLRGYLVLDKVQGVYNYNHEMK